MGKSTIEWTDVVWNPVRGCTKISPGCKHCYAETFAERFRGVRGHPYEQGFDLRLVPEKLIEPFRWREPRMVFANSMSDVFHKDVPDEYIAAVFGVMAANQRHTFQVLTKRADRMPIWFHDWLPLHYNGPRRVPEWASQELIRRIGEASEVDWPLPNVWVGVSVEDRQYGLPRIEHLRATPAAVRFLSIEPLLEDLGTLDLRSIDWVIAGGESGHGARPMQPEWVRSVRDQCLAARVPFFFKQWGGVRKKQAGRVLDGRTWDEMPRRAA